ncbi:hypothetical protein C5748_18250 [Phyllobacterium phragmitis]|uniref:Chromosomal replication initiator DnaA C-terminal domain-containing protein n=1 Tax=Phyllobacterium phragmitis TaxID=2670329 RepID=A0A2S9INJ6_9HYPH|nr:helix-turn-helix domain-containing protein [Phyllobacterium phragmitis]PRD42097.1 hypothetical protein C5748_18250 [Phyllobacterium phragmitis]
MFAVSYRHTESSPRYQQAIREQQMRERQRIEAEAVKLLPEPVEIKPSPKALREKAQREAVMRSKMRWGVSTPLDTIPAIIARVAHQHGFTYDDIIGLSRSRKLINVRFEAIAAVRAARPNMTLPEIGKRFNRDHTTILHALKKMGVKQTGAPRRVYDLDAIKEMRSRGQSYESIANGFGCSAHTISRLVAEGAR